MGFCILHEQIAGCMNANVVLILMAKKVPCQRDCQRNSINDVFEPFWDES